MAGGRGIRRRKRHRRIFAKKLHRTNSLSNQSSRTEDSSKILPLLFQFLLCLSIFIYFGIERGVLSLLFAAAFQKLKIYENIVSRVQTYKNNRQDYGPTIREKWYYLVDYWLSTYSYAKAIVLLALTWCLILTSGTLISWMAQERWVESLWAAALGSGLDWGFINSSNPSLRLVAVCTNVGGLVLTALLLSLISDAVQTKYDSLRKGESSVTEEGHTLIIGWSIKSLSVIIQLAKAGESAGTNVIVCLSDKREKEDMENDIAQCDYNFSKAGTRVVCRSGSPLSYHDLRKVSFCRARSIIILGDDEHDPETNDARSLQIVLAIVSGIERERTHRQNHINKENGGLDEETNRDVPRPDRIVIEVMDTENAAIMTSVCPELVEPVLAHDVVGRLMLQAARNPLVADVWQDLLGFDGCEIYSAQWGILRGLCFKDVLLCFEDAIPLGVKTVHGDLLLNPEDSYKIQNGDEVIVLAEDDDTYCASITHPLIREKIPDDSPLGYRYVDICPGGLDAIQHFSRKWAPNSSFAFSRLESKECFGRDEEMILFCGWRFDMGNLLQVFSAVAPNGSEFWILSELPIPQRETELRLRGWENNSKVKVVHHVGACRRNVLAQLPLESFTSVIVGGSETNALPHASNETKVSSDKNSSSNSESLGDADARVITVVMMIQDITMRRNADGRSNENSNQISNMLSRKPDRIMSILRSGSRRTIGGSSTRLMSATLNRARSQRFLGSVNTSECTAPRGVIVGEIVDSRSRGMLSMVNSIDAVVASSELISKAVAMVSEDRSVNRVLNTLFDPYDSEITLESIDTYIDIASNERVSFFELMARGRDVGTIVLGYLVRETMQTAEDQAATIRYTDVALNPPQKDIRRGWHPDDLLIVLTPGTSDTLSVGPSDLLTDIADVQSVDLGNMTRDFSWSEESFSLNRRSKVRFHGN